MEFIRILVPIDFSENSLCALKAAQSLASRFDSKLHLFHSHPIEFVESSVYASTLPAYYLEDLTCAATNRLHEWRLRHCDADLAVSEHLGEVAPAIGISELAETLPADLIVMGTRGLTGLKHVLLGSVAERVVRRAKCPVLTVKEQ